MALSVPHQQIRMALSEAGWRIVLDSPYSSGPNPSRLIVRKGRIIRQLIVYAWNITGEGKGRTKNDFRVQATRGHEGDLVSPPGYLVMGLGWHEGYEVFGGFNVWIKRTGRKSPSVHFTRTLLEAAKNDHWAEEMRRDGPTCAFKTDQIEKYFAWLFDQENRRFIRAEPTAYTVDGDDLTIRLDPRSDWQYLALRNDDCIVFRRVDGLLDDSVWRIRSIETDHQLTAGGSNRPYLDVHCQRHGVVRDASRFDIAWGPR